MLSKNSLDIMGQYIMTHSVFKCLLHNNAGRSKGKGGDGGVWGNSWGEGRVEEK